MPHEIDNTLYILRKTRNSAVHAGTDSVDEAKDIVVPDIQSCSLVYGNLWGLGIYCACICYACESTHEGLESVIAEQEKKIVELTKAIGSG